MQDFFDDKVQFYTGLPSYKILMVVLEHVSPFVARKTLSLDHFEEFVMVLMKLRLNIPLQDLAYCFKVSQPTVSRIFSSWLVVMDDRLWFGFLARKRALVDDYATMFYVFFWKKGNSGD